MIGIDDTPLTSDKYKGITPNKIPDIGYIIVKICGVPYTITREKDPMRVDHDTSGMKLFGQISYEKHSIKFLASSPEQEMRTVLHEILHGIIENGAIRELMNEHGSHLEAPINQLANGISESLESMGILLP